MSGWHKIGNQDARGTKDEAVAAAARNRKAHPNADYRVRRDRYGYFVEFRNKE